MAKKKLSAAAKQKAVKAAKALEAKHIKAASKATALAHALHNDDLAKAAKIAREHQEAAHEALPHPSWFDWLFGN